MLKVQFSLPQKDKVGPILGPFPWVQLTHEELRAGPNGDTIAFLSEEDQCWHIFKKRGSEKPAQIVKNALEVLSRYREAGKENTEALASCAGELAKCLEELLPLAAGEDPEAARMVKAYLQLVKTFPQEEGWSDIIISYEDNEEAQVQETLNRQAWEILDKAEAEIMAMTTARERAAHKEWPEPEKPEDFLFWMEDEAELQEQQAKDHPDEREERTAKARALRGFASDRRPPHLVHRPPKVRQEYVPKGAYRARP